MTKLLIIRAHPFTADASRSMAVTDAFIQSYKKANPKDVIEDTNLYDMAVPEIDRHLLGAWKSLGEGIPFDELTQEQQEKVTLFSGYTENFLSADKVVIANPLWNLNVPARLKAWIDTTNVSGKTFKYNELGEAVGLVTDKKILHIQSSGGAYAGNDPASVYVKTIFNFIGVSDFYQLFAEGMDHAPEKASQIMADAFEEAITLGQSF